MSLARKHIQLARRAAERRREGYTVVVRHYFAEDHWLLGYMLYSGNANIRCQREIVASRDTEREILELRRAFLEEFECQLAELERAGKMA